MRRLATTLDGPAAAGNRKQEQSVRAIEGRGRAQIWEDQVMSMNANHKVEQTMKRFNLVRVVLGFITVLGFVSHGIAADKVEICHIPPGNPANLNSIVVGANAVDKHLLKHGDFVGACCSMTDLICGDTGNACTTYDCAADSCNLVEVECGNIACMDLAGCDPFEGCEYTDRVCPVGETCNFATDSCEVVTIPPIPTNFDLDNPTTTSVLASWDDTPNEDSYELGWGQSMISSYLTVPAGTTSHNFTGLASGISWHFTIRACNVAGCSAYHEVFGCTPGGGAC